MLRNIQHHGSGGDGGNALRASLLWAPITVRFSISKEEQMSNHFTGLSLGPPLGDQRLDLCDLYAFQSPTDPSRTVIILNANPNADALHPDAMATPNIDTHSLFLTLRTLSWPLSGPRYA